MAGDIDFRITRRTAYYVLGAIIASENVGVHQHATRGRRIEPSEVEHGFRLAGSEKMPLAVYPRFDPSMIVVGMSPARGVYLAGRDAHSAQGCHRECGLLAASSERRPHCGEGRACAGIGRAVGHMFVTPMVDFKNGVAHRKVTDAVFQHVVEYHAAAVEGFIVHADGQHEMAELAFGYRLSPWHLVAGPERNVDVLPIEASAAVCQVGQWHVSVKKFECLTLFGCQRTVEYGKIAGLAELGLAPGKIVTGAVCMGWQAGAHCRSDEKR